MSLYTDIVDGAPIFYLLKQYPEFKKRYNGTYVSVHEKYEGEYIRTCLTCGVEFKAKFKLKNCPTCATTSWLRTRKKVLDESRRYYQKNKKILAKIRSSTNEDTFEIWRQERKKDKRFHFNKQTP